MQYGCIGAKLSHSYSRDIHAQLADYLYELTELTPQQLNTFLTERDFRAVNVTMPYKQTVIPYLAEIEPNAAQIGAVNTIVNQSGVLYGYNTDFGGMIGLIGHAGIHLQGKKVLILGTGGTSNTAFAVAKHLGAAEIYKVSRREKSGTLTYDAVKKEHLDAQILINTTPCGMFPNLGEMAIDPVLFPRLCGVVDAVYNPLRSALVCKAQSLGVPAAGGLYMLVEQAVLASQHFLATTYPVETTERIYKALRIQKENIVLTGMPGCGKTTVGQLLAEKMGRRFIDTDTLVEEKTGLSPAQIIAKQGEAAFRELESAVVRELSAKTGLVIATGGGAVLRQENVAALKQNGRIFFLDRPVEQLLPTDDRPLSSTKESLQKRFAERYDIYISTADAVIPNTGSIDNTLQLLERSFFL